MEQKPNINYPPTPTFEQSVIQQMWDIIDKLNKLQEAIDLIDLKINVPIIKNWHSPNDCVDKNGKKPNPGI